MNWNFKPEQEAPAVNISACEALDNGNSTTGETLIDSRCGLHCTGCEWKDSTGCRGCIETDGNPFHGCCPVAQCCQNKGFSHCGECPDLPCELLKQYSLDPEHGDNPPGKRIQQCRKWRGLTTK